MMRFNVSFNATNNNFITSFADSSQSFRADFGDVQTATKVIVPSPYEGAYSITPTAETQTLSTQHKTALHDIVINPIPSNYGLITYNGFEIMVS